MLLVNAFKKFSASSREWRASLLKHYIQPDSAWKILDLGGGTGDHIAAVFPGMNNITVCDYSDEDLEVARRKHGYATVRADGSNELPFATNQFDFVFCSSVIEHVTGPKDEVIAMENNSDFQKVARQHQKVFADEIRRIGKRYFVQTPHKYFLVESHSWLPFGIVMLPRRQQAQVLRTFAHFWPKSTVPDWNLLVAGEMQTLFPDADVVIERFAGLPKSIMAIKATN
jgi:hypothetical protein